MKKSFIGWGVVLLGSILMSIELYGLKIFQLLERNTNYAPRSTALEYLLEPSIFIAVLIADAIIIAGIVLINSEDKKGGKP